MKIDEIIVKDRIRKDAGGMMELINDIKANGLINPVTVNTDHVLLAGYRRLSACKALGWTDIPVHMVSTENEEQDLNDVMTYIQNWEPEVQFDGKAGTEAYKSYLDAMNEGN